MNILSKFFGKKEAEKKVTRAMLPNYKKDYAAAHLDRLTTGWTTMPVHIDHIIRTELRVLRARAREQARNNDYARRFITVAQNNIVGSTGVMVQAQVKSYKDSTKMDEAANEAIEHAWKDWGTRACTTSGSLSFVDIQNLAVSTCAQDGEFIAIKHIGLEAGPYGFQLELVDPELLDVDLNRQTSRGTVIRLGIEYDSAGRALQHYFKEVDYSTGTYQTGAHRIIDSKRVIHLFRTDVIGQNRGVPWLSTALFRMKMLAGYEDAAITAARVGASKMGFYTSPDGTGYVGDDTDSDGNLISEAEPGMMEQLPDGVSFQAYDPTYPHEQFGAFMKSCLRGISSGLGLSYHTLANDLEGVNYTSSRTGALEDREQWKALQTWIVNGLVRDVYETFIIHAVLARQIKIGQRPLAGEPESYLAARYQGRRWDWVDPKKDTEADTIAVGAQTMSISEVIRKRGRDPDEVFREIAEDERKMDELGIAPPEEKTTQPDEEEDGQEDTE